MVHLRGALPIGLTELAWAFIWYFATVLLGLVFADESLGWFGASHRALMALHTFVWLYFFNLLPSISRCVSLPHQSLLSLMARSMKFAAWTSIFGAFVLTVLSHQVLVFAYGPEFDGGAHSFAVLVWMLPVAMLSGHHRYILIAYNLQNHLLYCTAIAAVIAIGLGFALVPLFGATGAAWALLAANLMNFALAYRAVRRCVVTVPFHDQLPQPLLALAVATTVFFLLSNLNIWLAVVIASLAYLTVMLTSQGRNMLSLFRIVTEREPESKESLAG